MSLPNSELADFVVNLNKGRTELLRLLQATQVDFVFYDYNEELRIKSAVTLLNGQQAFLKYERGVALLGKRTCSAFTLV